MDIIDSVIRFADSVGTTPDDVFAGLLRFSSLLIMLRVVANGVVVYGVFRFFEWFGKRRQKKP